MTKVKINQDDLHIVEYYLTEARNHGVSVEVIAWALKYMKEDPNISIAEAIALGSSEWIK